MSSMRSARASTCSWKNRSPPIQGSLHRLLQGGRRGREEERQDHGGSAVPPFARPPGSDRQDPQRRDGGHPADPRQSPGRSRLDGTAGTERQQAGGSTQLRPHPSLLDWFGPHGGLPDSPDRRMLLDQGRVARFVYRHGRASIRQHRLRAEPRRVFDGIHVRGRHRRPFVASAG